MNQISSLVGTGQTVVVSLLVNPWAQAALAVALALVASALLGPDGASAQIDIGSGGHR